MIPYRLPILILWLFMTLPLFSQSYIGLKGGINQSHATFLFNIDPIQTTNRGDLYGFYFGMPMEFTVNELFNFIPEIAFVAEGSVLSVQVLEEQRTYSNAIVYAKVPIMGKLKLLKKKYYEFGIVGGIVPALAVDVRSYYYASTNLTKSVNVEVNFEEAGIRRFDLALSLGLNTEKVIAQGWKLVLDVRYNLGLLDIESHSKLTNTTESLHLTIGLISPIFNREKIN